jgi:hypothetical protein
MFLNIWVLAKKKKKKKNKPLTNNIMKNISKEGLAEVKNMAIKHLKNTPDCYGCDLHNEIYNTDYFIIGRYQAEQWLIANYGIFAAIDTIKTYENDNFGEVNTDLSESEKVVNMLVYIIGEEVLNESETLQNSWDLHLNDEICEAIIKELE